MKTLIILMRYNKVGYTYDPNSKGRHLNYLLPLGLAYISAVLKRAGKDVSCLNINHRDGSVRDVVRDELASNKYDIIFLGGLSLFYPHIRDIINHIREFSNAKIVVGGGIMTSQPELMFNLLKPDYGIIGEGELTALELVNHFENGGDVNSINGLVHSIKDGYSRVTVINKPRDQIKDLDALPFPDYASFGYEEYLDHIKPTDYIAYDVVDKPRYYPLLAGRSCPFGCTFCFHPLGNKYVQRSVDNIMDEIKQNVEKYNINIIFIYDELFSHDRERMIDFCTKFKAYSDTLPYKLWFYCKNRVDSTTDETLKIMKASGAYLLSFGLESYSQTVLDSMKKHTKPEQINRIVHLMRENELGIQGSFIFGDVAETMETARETLDFLKDNRKLIGTGVATTFIIPFQGTPIYKQCIKEGIIKDELQFIKDREVAGYNFLDPMNMTKLSDKDFGKLKDEVYIEHLTAGAYATPIIEWVDSKGDTYIKVKCPYCGKTSQIMNVPTPHGEVIRNIGCRHCFYRFNLVSKVYPIGNLFMKLMGFRRVYWLNNIRYGIMRRLLKIIGRENNEDV